MAEEKIDDRPVGIGCGVFFVLVVTVCYQKWADKATDEFFKYLPISYLLFVTLWGLLAWLGLRLVFHKRPGTAQDPFPKPYYPLWARNLGRAALGVDILILVVWCVYQSEPGHYLYTWVKLYRCTPPVVELEPPDATVNIGDDCTLRVLIDGKLGMAPYQAKWDAGTDTWYAGPNFEAIPYRPQRDSLQPNGKKDVTVAVDVKDAHGRSLGRATGVIHVTYSPVLKVTATHRRIFAGASTTVTVTMNGETPDPSVSCHWEADRNYMGDDGPEIIYRPTVASEKEEKHQISVRLLDASKREIGKGAKVEITVVRPRENYFVYVVDSSARMGAQIGGRSLLDALKEDLLNDLSDLGIAGAYSGVFSFGLPPDDAMEPCKNVDETIELAPVDLPKASDDLKRLKPGQQEAPLLLAIERALTALATHKAEGTNLNLIVLTGGPDNCRGFDPATYLENMHALLTDVKLETLWREYRMLTLTIPLAFSDAEASRWRGWLPRAEGAKLPHIVLLPKDMGSLRRILTDVSQLSSLEFNARKAACSDLVTLLREQKDDQAASAVEEYCKQLSP